MIERLENNKSRNQESPGANAEEWQEERAELEELADNLRKAIEEREEKIADLENV